MDQLSRRIVGIALVLSVVISSYLVMVHIVNGFGMDEIFKSFKVKSLRNSSPTSLFVVGDTVVFEVGSAWASMYDVSIYKNSSLVFSKGGGFNKSVENVVVSLNPPTFNAGNVYVASFSLHVCNRPVLGTYFTDCRMFTFETTSAATKLSLQADYSSTLCSLLLRGNLTDVEEYSVANENVEFSAQFSNRQRVTNGWVPLGSAQTNADGVARLSLAFSWPNGNYSIKARHEENENFGESEGTADVKVVSNESVGSLGLSLSSEQRSLDLPSEGGDGNLTVTASSYVPYALLPMNISARYSVGSPLEGECVVIYFFLDYMNITGFLGGVLVEPQESPPYYIYEGLLFWSPEVVGSHKVIAGVVNGTMYEIIAGQQGIGIVASAEVNINVQPCPTNMILEHAEAVYGDVLPVTVVFSRPRPYQVESTDFYVTSTLAPELVYNGVDYVIDDPVDSVPIEFFVNGTLESVNSTNEDGLAFFSLELSFSGHITLNVTSSVNGSVLLYERSFAQRVVNFTRISVHDVATNGSEALGLNYTICNHEEDDEIYVGTENVVMAEVSLFGLPLWSAPFSFVIAKNISRSTTSSGLALIPSGLSYLRVLKVYETLQPSQHVKIRFDNGQEVCVDVQGLARIPSDATNLTVIEEPLIGDVDGDGIVTIYDVVIVTSAYGSKPGDPNWDPRADLDNDGDVDLYDLVDVTGNYGDTFVIDADLEFFEVCFDRESVSNNLGLATEMWEPCETGTYVVEVRLPSSFNVTLPSWSDVTQVNASVSLINCFDVVKRPLDLSLDYVPEEPTLDDEVTMIANVFDLGLGEPAEDLLVGFGISGLTFPDGEKVWIGIGYEFTNSSGVATLSFVPRDYYEDYNLFPYFYVVVGCLETWCTLYSEAYVLLDTRYPTRLEFLGDEVISTPVGKEWPLGVRLVRADNGDPVVNRSILIYMNETLVYPKKDNDWHYTDEDGFFLFNITVLDSGVYFFRVQFSWGEGYLDVLYEDLNNVTFVIVAQPAPVFILFEVQPKEFRPGTTVTLSATVFNATSDEPLEDFHVWFYWCADNDTMGVVGSDLTDGEGVASVTWLYPESDVFVFWAYVSTAQQIMSSPVTLTVGKETELSMNVEQGEGFNHVVSGRLLCDGVGVADEQVVIKVNGTIVDVVTTAGDGSYSTTLNLQPEDNEATNYQVEAVYYGDDALNLMLYDALPDDTEYAVCTTLQYFSYKPSSNTTWLTVEPQATQVMTQTKTPEEMQQEAEDEGWLSTWHEFSWWYPWYRLHVQINMNGALIHVGFNPILPGGEIVETLNLGNFIVPITDPTIPLEELAQLVQEMIESSIVDVLGLAAITFAAGNSRFPPVIAIALSAYCSGLFLLGNHGVNLYNAGSKNAGKAFMAGIAIGLAAVLLTTVLGMAFFSGATITLTNVIFAMIGASVGNLYDPAPLMDFTRAIITASLAAIAVSAIALRIPEPIGNLFYCLFLIITSTAMCISAYMTETI